MKKLASYLEANLFLTWCIRAWSNRKAI